MANGLRAGIRSFAVRRRAQQQQAEQPNPFEQTRERISAGEAEAEEARKKQFALARQRLTSQRGRTQRQSNLGFDRFAAITGRTGGAVQKARSQAQQDVGREFGELEAGLGAQEAAIEAQAKEGSLGRELQVGQLEQQQRQFEAQLRETARQFDLEFDENKKTNLINSLALLEDTGLDSIRQFNDFQKIFGDLFPGLRPLPAPASGERTQTAEGRDAIREALGGGFGRTA